MKPVLNMNALAASLRRIPKTPTTAVLAATAFLTLCAAVILGPASPATPWLWSASGLTLLLLALLRLEELLRLLRGVNWRTSLPASTVFAAFLGILVLANLIASRRPLRIDLTSERLYTLSPVSRAVLKELQEPVRITFFRTPNQANRTVEDILRLYTKASRLVSLETVDPTEKPGLAQRYDLQALPFGEGPLYSTIIIEHAGRTEKLEGLKVDFLPDYTRGMSPVVDYDRDLERKISSAIDRLRGPSRKVYFTAGHGEGDLDSPDRQGFSRLKNQIRQENYDIDTLHLAVSSGVPADASLVVILDPRRRFDDREIATLRAYLREGGRLLVLANPRRPHGLNRLLSEYGILLSDMTVYDPGSSYWFQAAIPYVTRYGLHPATEHLTAATVFPEAVAVLRAASAPSNTRLRDIVRTSDRSWAEADPPGPDGRVAYDKERDLKGPVTLGLSSETPLDDQRSTEIVVFGDADFVANAFLDLGANLDLFLNTLNHLAGRRELSGIPSRASSRRLMILSNETVRFLFLVSVVLLPAAVLVAAAVLFLRRRSAR